MRRWLSRSNDRSSQSKCSVRRQVKATKNRRKSLEVETDDKEDCQHDEQGQKATHNQSLFQVSVAPINVPLQLHLSHDAVTFFTLVRIAFHTNTSNPDHFIAFVDALSPSPHEHDVSFAFHQVVRFSTYFYVPPSPYLKK